MWKRQKIQMELLKLTLTRKSLRYAFSYFQQEIHLNVVWTQCRRLPTEKFSLQVHLPSPMCFRFKTGLHSAFSTQLWVSYTLHRVSASPTHLPHFSLYSSTPSLQVHLPLWQRSFRFSSQPLIAILIWTRLPLWSTCSDTALIRSYIKLWLFKARCANAQFCRLPL